MHIEAQYFETYTLKLEALLSKEKKSKLILVFTSIVGFGIAFFFTGVAFTENEYFLLIFSLIGILTLFAGIAEYNEIKMHPVLTQGLDYIVGLVMICLLVLIGVGIYETGPYSIYFIGIGLVYLVITYLFKSKLNKLIDKGNKKNNISLFILYYVRNSIRMFFVALIPIVLFQAALDNPRDFGLREKMEAIEDFYIHFSHFLVNYHVSEVLLSILVFLLIAGPFITYKSNVGKYIVSKMKGSLFLLNITVFIFSFSFFTSVYAQYQEKTWRFDIRDNITSEEKYLREAVEKYWVLTQIELNQEIQNNVVKVLAATVATASSYEIAVTLYRKAWYDKSESIDTVKLEISYDLNKDLSVYGLSSINDFFKPGYSPHEIRKLLKDIREKESKVYSFKRASKDSLSQTLSTSLSLVIPEYPNEVVKHLVDDVVDSIADFKIKFLLKDTNKKVLPLILATHLLITEPSKSIITNESFVSAYTKSLNSIDSKYLSKVYPEAYELHMAAEKLSEDFKNAFEKAKYSNLEPNGIDGILKRLSR